jgi:threonine aldolase
MVTPTPADEAVAAAMRRCDRSIRGHGLRRPADVLADLQAHLPDDAEADTYGSGGLVEVLEAEVAAVLGAPAAVFLPSGTMAQQIALRVHADRRGRSVVALHPTSHLVLHEARAVERLHGLRSTTLGSDVRPWALGDVEGLAEPVAAVAVELPLRELGGILPPWSDVTGLREAAHGRGAAVHLDGARIWEAAAGYGRTPADVAACADSTYVSFYKGLGAIAGAALVGDADLLAQARTWRHRHGGTLFALWPYAASCLQGLRTRLPRMGAYLEATRAIAAGLAGTEGVEVVPDVPDTAMLHLHLRVDDAAFRAAVLQVAETEGIATWQACQPTVRPRWWAVELAAGDATLALGADAVVDVIRRIVAAADVDRAVAREP